WEQDGKEFTQSVRSGVTIPYSPEFAEMESNTALLEKIRSDTGGAAYVETDRELGRIARSGEIFRPIPFSRSSLQTLWPWFVFFAGLCLLGDVAVRRIAVDPLVVWAKASTVWERMRGHAVVDTGTQTLERLRSRKVQAAEAIAKQAAR